MSRLERRRRRRARRPQNLVANVEQAAREGRYGEWAKQEQLRWDNDPEYRAQCIRDAEEWDAFQRRMDRRPYYVIAMLVVGALAAFVMAIVAVWKTSH